jgi:uncharacterized protein (TIGR03437 family)
MDHFGNPWVFDSWSVGGGQNTIYEATNINVPVTITGKFVRAAAVDVMTSPAGLPLEVDGRSNWPNHTFVWAVGSSHRIAAPEETADSRGRRYVFSGWSNGGPRVQDVRVDQSALDGSMRLTARYELLSRTTVNSSVPGAKVLVDGLECATPCHIDRPSGTTVAVAAPPAIPVSAVERLEFHSWSDGGAATRTVTVNGSEAATLTAGYERSFLLRLAADPPDAATLRTEPALSDGFYPAGSLVRVVAQPVRGYRFRRWELDASGGATSATVLMDGAKIARALLDNVPSIAEAGIRNAAGITPDAVVAPGSIVSIFGNNLTQAMAAAPAGQPLSQVLAGVVVRMGDRLLPLFFAGPDQINVLMPSDVEDGTHALAVQAFGRADIQGTVEVVRNAPGLFTTETAGGPVALAAHADGSPVTAESPVKRGETITLYGTGFGAYDRTLPDGFPAPAEPRSTLLDKVQLMLGETVVEPVWSGAAPGLAGVAAIRFVTPDSVAGNVPVSASVNGRTSNQVILPTSE